MLLNQSPTYAHSVNSGVVYEHEFDLADLTGRGISGLVGANVLGFTKASVTIQTIGATGTSGDATIKQSNNQSLADGEAPTGASAMTLTDDTTLNQFDLEVSGMFLIVDFTAATIGEEGKIKVIIVAKR